MPTNKNAAIRYQTLDRCFGDYRHRYYLEDLIDKCEEALYYYNGIGGVSRRQIFEDIKFMESKTGWNIPLERHQDGRRVYYRYNDPNFTINAQPLTEEEANQLRAVILTLSRFRGLPCNAWVDEVISNLEWRFGLRGKNENVIGFEQNPFLKGLNLLPEIIDVTVNHQVVRITYRNYKTSGEERSVVVHPWYVKQYNNRWFLMAYDAEADRITNFALDRIQELQKEEGIAFIPNKEIDFEHYFDDVFGVTIPPADVEKIRVVLQFSKKQYPYIASKPLHHSQVIIDNENGIIAVEVRPTYEFIQLILSFGSDVRVLEPEPFKKEIIANIRRNIQNYDEMQIGCTHLS
ncbi:MAG: helix-turn-helix transcriptional regulator [Prevotella sp.]